RRAVPQLAASCSVRAHRSSTVCTWLKVACNRRFERTTVSTQSPMLSPICSCSSRPGRVMRKITAPTASAGKTQVLISGTVSLDARACAMRCFPRLHRKIFVPGNPPRPLFAAKPPHLPDSRQRLNITGVVRPLALERHLRQEQVCPEQAPGQLPRLQVAPVKSEPVPLDAHLPRESPPMPLYARAGCMPNHGFGLISQPPASLACPVRKVHIFAVIGREHRIKSAHLEERLPSKCAEAAHQQERFPASGFEISPRLPEPAPESPDLAAG